MFSKCALIAAFLTSFLTFQIKAYNVEIGQKTSDMNKLSAIIEKAQETPGLPETVDNVERIGLIQQLKGEIAELQESKNEFELKQ